jgi:hypothetical protein
MTRVSRYRENGWTGRFHRVEPDGTVQGLECVRCGRELTTPESQRMGIGPVCVGEVSEAQIEELHAKAWDWDRRMALGLRQVNARRNQLRKGPKLSAYRRARSWDLPTGTDDADERWAVFQAAMGRRRSL